MIRWFSCLPLKIRRSDFTPGILFQAQWLRTVLRAAILIKPRLLRLLDRGIRPIQILFYGSAKLTDPFNQAAISDVLDLQAAGFVFAEPLRARQLVRCSLPRDVLLGLIWEKQKYGLRKAFILISLPGCNIAAEGG